eukprot:TRINITY_DN15554_c0_g1_i1.p1 TRINITY_DN15554_c0_g1~~TRINITY_DN15554_c0_g1_i1.p1  ORF type:complete len:286 (+),score=60.88 TRINITY_DN15554_c0_g1_i1:75-932(+)
MGNATACTVCCTDLAKKSAPQISSFIGEDLPGLSYSPTPRHPAAGAPAVGEMNMVCPRSLHTDGYEGTPKPAAVQKSAPRVAPAPASGEVAVAATAERISRDTNATSVSPTQSVRDTDRLSRGASDVASAAGASAAASDSTATSLSRGGSSQLPGQAQQVVKNFVKTYVKGHQVSVLNVNGGLATCLASLDRSLTTLSLQRANKKDAKKRGIPLEDIGEVCVGTEGGDDVELPLDELCVTLLLTDGQATCFRFGDIEERDTFALCLSMFIDGRRAEVSRKKKKGK